jgi:cell wall-associated NlpC family hydrolase
LQAAEDSGKEIDISTDLTLLLPGDLVFMRGVRGFYRDSLFGGREISIGHVGIYIGDNTVIHAQAHDAPYGVIIQSISDMTKDPHYAITFAKRF